MKRSAIGWADYSGGDCNFVTGCGPISPGCEHCYARAIYERFGKNFDEVRVHEDKLSRLAKTKFPQEGNKRGYQKRPVVFVCDMSDLFHPDVPTDFVARVFEMMAKRQDVVWAILTKRPQMMAERLSTGMVKDVNYRTIGFHREYLPNVWLGVTVEDQARAEQRIPVLLRSWKGTTFVSVEPMLEPVDFWNVAFGPLTTMNVLEGVGTTSAGGMRGQSIPNCHCKKLDWVICGAESGPNRRDFQVSWASELKQQCQESGVAFFGKQDSGLRAGRPLLFRGYEVHEWPA
jgi:protein gp37